MKGKINMVSPDFILPLNSETPVEHSVELDSNVKQQFYRTDWAES